MDFKINERQLAGIRNAINRNPQKVVDETGKFLKRGIAAHMSTISRNPWRVGGRGGGAPIDTGGLRESHQPPIYSRWEAKIQANRTGTAPYFAYVHEGTRYMQARPWLDHSVEKNRATIDKLQRELLDNITKDLAR